jgi:eukaryotic-like serine/threonine-protein kinase
MSSDPFELIGQIVGGQFRVDAVAGDADLSVVYRGLRLDANTAVAIKCLNRQEAIPDELARALDAAFQQAFRVHDRLARGHQNIAQTLTSGETRSPRTGAVVPYIVREWLEGESLAAELAGRQKDLRPIRPLEEIVGLLKGAFEAVAFAHEQGEVHLGLNPGNLFVATRDDGTVTLKVLDFGLARMLNDFAPEVPSESHSGSGLRRQLPGYAAPEQIDESLGPPGARTDVYALALIAMEALAGQKLPPFLEEALNRALSPSPRARQATAGELWSQMCSAVAPRPARASIAGTFDPPALSKAPPKSPERSPDAQPASHGARPPSSTYGPVAVPTTPEAPEPGAQASPGSLFSSASIEGHEPMTAPAIEPGDLIKANEIPSLVPPVLALGSEPASRAAGAPVAALPRKALVLASAAAAAVVVLATGTVAALRAHRGSASTASATVERAKASAAPATADALQPIASPLASSAASGEAPPDASQQRAANDSTTAPPQAKFAAAAARRALDATKHDVSRCRHGRVWGYASATVTFANDGSVDKVAVAPRLAGTQTGACAAEALAAVHVAPFGGSPGQVSYRFYVSPK